MTKEFLQSVESAILAGHKGEDNSDLDEIVLPKKAPFKDEGPKSLPGTGDKVYDNSNTYGLTVVLPGKPDPNATTSILTDDQKKKRTVYIMGAILAAIIILIIALSMRKK